ASQDQFHDQMVGAVVQTDSNSEIKLPLWRKVEVQHGENLVLLFAEGFKVRQGPKPAIILHPRGNDFGQIVTDFPAWGELKATAGVWASERPAKSRIEREIPTPELLINDWPNFHVPSGFGI